VENDSNILPLINTLSRPDDDFLALKMTDSHVNVSASASEWALIIEGAKFAYVESLLTHDQYWMLDI
jgi:hypothetical protein